MFMNADEIRIEERTTSQRFKEISSFQSENDDIM
jgi:hypothetical protein